MDNTNFNVAFILLTTDPELQADMRRYFRVVLLFEKNTFLNSIFSTIDTDEMEAPSCGKEGFLIDRRRKRNIQL